MSVITPLLGLLGFFALTAGTAVFVAAEFSLTALERSTVDAHAKDGDARARQVQHAHRTLSFQLSGAQLGITITTLITGFIAEPVLAQFLLPLLDALGATDAFASATSLALALIIATSLSMVLGELVPKNLAISRPLPTARATAGLQAGFSLIFKWAITGLNSTANWIVRRLGVEPADELRSARSPQELAALVRNSARQGALDDAMATLVDRSLRFGDRTAEELMTPRVKIESLTIHATVDDLLALAHRTGFSRFPVTEGDLDDTVGVVHIKDAFMVPIAKRSTTALAELAQPVPKVPNSLDGDSVMEHIRAHGMQIALVVDEYGGTAGVVTVEDLIEEIFGDVRDEHDSTESEVEESATGWELSGLLRIDELTSATGYVAPHGEYETLGGLVLTHMGYIPQEGDTVLLPPSDHAQQLGELGQRRQWRATVVRMDGRRIDRVGLVRPLKTTSPQREEHHG